MRKVVLAGFSLILGLAVVIGGGWSVPNAPVNSQKPVPPSDEHPPLAVCFAAGTPEAYMAEWQQRIWSQHPLDFQMEGRWSHTANQQNTGGQGDPVQLTVSFVPDGVIVDGQPNQLFSRMNQLFNGDQQLWQSKIQQVFERWSQVSGLRYQFVDDDGAPFGQNSPGVLGSRGDVRISSIPIDGPSGILAYDYFPNTGDMVLDASEEWGNGQQDYIFLRNIVAHEHGHGWGLAHVCPTNSTKLLEPYYSSAFDGPQHDDIRAAQRNYGDTFEPNDNAESATRLGTLNALYTVSNVSLDDNSDTDFFKFSIPAGKGFTLNLNPVGHSYLDGQQNSDGSCTAGTNVNTLDDQNLDLFLHDASGAQILAQSATHPAGESERIYRYQPTAQGDSFIVEISGATANTIQMYELVFDVYNSADPYLSVSPVAFDTTQLNQSVTRTTLVLNPGTQPLTLNSISATPPFSVLQSAPQTIPPSGSLELTLNYAGQTLGQQTGTITITHNGPGGTLQCPLSGTTVTSFIQFVNGTQIKFGDVPINTTDSTAVVIRAQGNVPTTILSIQFTGPFSINLGLPVSLNPTQSLITRPHFNPTQLGDANGLMIITHTAPTSPDTVYLHGTGAPNLSAPPTPDLPTVYKLEQNYPNPFNPTTTIAFDLPRASQTRLDVFDITGRLVREVANGDLPAGHHTVSFDGVSLPSGMYVYRLATPEFTDLHKMMLLK